MKMIRPLIIVAILATSLTGLAQETPVSLRKAADASVDRNIVMPTAETLGKGEWAINSYELLGFGVSYGVADQAHVSFTTIAPITTDFPIGGILSGKFQVVETSRFLFALQPSASWFTQEGDSAGTVSLNAACDFVLDQQGRVALTLAEVSTWSYSGDGNIGLGDAALFLLSGGINGRVGKFVKLMGEVVLIATYADGDFDFVDEGFFFNYGIRFFGRTLAADLSFIRPVGEDTGEFLMGIPYVSFTARFD